MIHTQDPIRGGGPVLAVDLGATKCEVGLVDATGAVSLRRRVPTGGVEDGEVLFGAIAGAVREVLAAAPAPPVGCGVGSVGPMAPGGVVSPVNLPCWRSFPLQRRLAEVTGLPTFVDNDAKALVAGEAWLGAGRGRSGFLGMVVSTGVGGGIVCDGRLLEGGSGNAGHIGHIVVEPEGRRCRCGARGCLEAEASGTAIAEITGRPAAEAPREVRERTGRLVGRAVATVVTLLDLPLAVVAGSVALGFGAPFLDAAQEELGARARLAFTDGATIRFAALGADGPLVGAAAVARNRMA